MSSVMLWIRGCSLELILFPKLVSVTMFFSQSHPVASLCFILHTCIGKEIVSLDYIFFKKSVDGSFHLAWWERRMQG